MQIDLNRNEINKILKEKFGKAFFRVFYIESDKCWEQRNNKKISELKESTKIEKKCYLLYFDED